jgi:hypothetical protein
MLPLTRGATTDHPLRPQGRELLHHSELLLTRVRTLRKPSWAGPGG